MELLGEELSHKFIRASGWTLALIKNVKEILERQFFEISLNFFERGMMVNHDDDLVCPASMLDILYTA